MGAMLGSLTGGGGMSASSSATATNGDFSGGAGGYSVGNMNFNGSNASNTISPLLILGAVIGIYLIWKK